MATGTPALADGTDFGSTTIGNPLTQIFKVENTGALNLTTSGLTLPSGFSLIEGLSGTIGAGLFDTFTVQLDALLPGTYSGNISFANNDGDENPFNFAITGEVTANVVPEPEHLRPGPDRPPGPGLRRPAEEVSPGLTALRPCSS